MSKQDADDSLTAALRTLLRHPSVLVRQWNWKAAAFSALVRGFIFLVVNRHASHAQAARATLVELVYATVAAGLAGAATQRLRHAKPLAATAAVLCVAVPLLMLTGDAVVHHSMGTPRVRAGLLASFAFAALATGFNWFAMRHGVFVTGNGFTFPQDLKRLAMLIMRLPGHKGAYASPRLADPKIEK